MQSLYRRTRALYSAPLMRPLCALLLIVAVGLWLAEQQKPKPAPKPKQPAPRPDLTFDDESALIGEARGSYQKNDKQRRNGSAKHPTGASSLWQ